MNISIVRNSITSSIALTAIVLGAAIGNSGCATTPSYAAQKQKRLDAEAEQALLTQDANPKTVYSLARLYIAQNKGVLPGTPKLRRMSEVGAGGLP